ncbi:MAG: sensor histidine kinase [Candidatus Thorarchaeota archaeon]
MEDVIMDSENPHDSQLGDNPASMVRRVDQILTRPSDDITDDTLRVKARFLSAVLILLILILPFLQLLLGSAVDGQPVYLALMLLSVGIYSLSRTRHVLLAGIFTTLGLASMPFLFLSYSQQWAPTRIVFNILIWPLVAALIGSQWLTTRQMGCFIAVEASLLLVYTYLHQGIEFIVALEPIFDQAALSIVVLLFTWITNYYVTQLRYRQEDLEQRQRELEVHTSVLTHDLGNDMQILRGSVELLDVLEDVDAKHQQNIETALAVSDRMGSVIKLFASVGRQREYDFLLTLNEIAANTEKVFKGMKVEVKVWPSVVSSRIRVGILLPLVIENLLRNTAEYAGLDSVAKVCVWMKEDTLEIEYRDTGPGIPESVRPRIFQKGVSSGGEGKGLGLYLSYRIVESYGGTIELTVDSDTGQDLFRISIPIR